MINRIYDNIEICEQKLLGITWITQDPSRQWTSSINPIMQNPREFYGNHYVQFSVGLDSKIEQTVRLLRKRNNMFNLLNKDLITLIIEKLVLANTKFMCICDRKCGQSQLCNYELSKQAKIYIEEDDDDDDDSSSLEDEYPVQIQEQERKQIGMSSVAKILAAVRAKKLQDENNNK